MTTEIAPRSRSELVLARMDGAHEFLDLLRDLGLARFNYVVAEGITLQERNRLAKCLHAAERAAIDKRKEQDAIDRELAAIAEGQR